MYEAWVWEASNETSFDSRSFLFFFNREKTPLSLLQLQLQPNTEWVCSFFPFLFLSPEWETPARFCSRVLFLSLLTKYDCHVLQSKRKHVSNQKLTLYVSAAVSGKTTEKHTVSFTDDSRSVHFLPLVKILKTRHHNTFSRTRVTVNNFDLKASSLSPEGK